MEKKNNKIINALKYVVKVVSLTALTILIIVGLALLFVFVSTKFAQANGQRPPVNLYTIISPSMTPNINVYDVVVTVKTEPSKIKVGDVISFYSTNPNVGGYTITHRVTAINKFGEQFVFSTKGDFNKYADEEPIPDTSVVGKVYFKIPLLGKVQFFLGSKGGWIIAIMIPALGIIAYDIYKIIKLILIKQKIQAYQSQEDLQTASKETVETMKGLYENKEPIEKVEETKDKEYEIQKEEIIDQEPETQKEEVINIDEKEENQDNKMVSALDEEIKKMEEWASKINDENK